MIKALKSTTQQLGKMTALEAYTKPQSNQILSRYQLRCLKQGDMPLEEFITKARLLIEDGGYDSAAKETTLRDTLVFGVASDKVRKDAIALGNSLTFKQVYDLAKVDESTKAQMKIISKGEYKADLHTVQRESAHSSKKNHRNRASSTKLSSATNGVQLGDNLAHFSSSQTAASDAVIPTTNQQAVLRIIRNVNTAARSATTQGCACNNAFEKSMK